MERSLDKTLLNYRFGSLGDTVVSLPCFHKIMESSPNHRRIVLTNFPMSSKAAPLDVILKNGGFTHGSISHPYKTRNPLRLIALAREIRRLKTDTMIYLVGGRGLRAVYRDLLFFRLAGIRRIIGAPVTRDLDSCRVNTTTGLMEREGVRLVRCLAAALGPIDITDPAMWDLRLTSAEIGAAKAVLADLGGARFVAVNTGGKLAVQDWGEANWTERLSQLSLMIDVPLVFVGGAEDSDRATRSVRFTYHFWTSDMKPLRRRSGNQHLHRASPEYRDAVGRKLHAYHVFIQAAVVCQGLLQYLAVAFPQRVWDAFGFWPRTFAKFLIERQDTDKMQAFRFAS
jgi:ADP-heptose:LPS heptosyltransferase